MGLQIQINFYQEKKNLHPIENSWKYNLTLVQKSGLPIQLPRNHTEKEGPRLGLNSPSLYQDIWG